MRNRFPDAQFSSTISFGADVWDRIFPGKGRPKELEVFKEIKGSKQIAVSTLVIYCFISALSKWGYVTSLPLLLMKS